MVIDQFAELAERLWEFGSIEDIRRAIVYAIDKERQACAEIIHQEYLAYMEKGFSATQCLVDAEKKIRARVTKEE